jgi:hypothetical protein
MFTSNKVSKEMLDAVNQVLAQNINEEEKKKMLLEPEDDSCVTPSGAKTIAKKEVGKHEKEMHKEEDDKKSPFNWKNTPRETLKPGERTGHEHKKTDTGNVFLKKFKKDKEDVKEENKMQGSSTEKLKKQNEKLTGVRTTEEYELTEEMLDNMINEVLSKDATAGDWIHDFVHSKNPKFAGKSKAERKKMALGAYYKTQKEEVVQEENDSADDLKKKIASVKYEYQFNHGSIDTANHQYADRSSDFQHGEKLYHQYHKLQQRHKELTGHMAEEALDQASKSTDTLYGRVKGGKDNQHTSIKVKLKAEEKLKESKRPTDEVPFVTNEETPMKLAKNLAKKSFSKIRKETLGMAGGTSEESK